ncbi:hypothetical protein [Amycolatopsis suaedae]|uniref:PE domain-containing protein n=1 Tax=Amycolatopsis suaedae TaxID=2510978 RepID=A0A4Q7JCL9_9PSEU|nr:hypothetical protein [Amycolatopsis suaedae]RZQ65057.1 hypothetical protein EWH70_03910 [Amycolatopsis suaedae]
MGNVNMSAPGGAGGFQFDPVKLDAVIGKWKQLQEDLANDKADGELMANVKAPGKEFASGDFTKGANPSGKAFLEQNTKMREYVDNYVRALEDAKRKMQTGEEQAMADVNKSGAMPQ